MNSTSTDDQLLEQEFLAYVQLVQEKTDEIKSKHPREIGLALYAHAKQGRFGEKGFKEEKEPGFFDIAGKLKYNAWKEIQTIE